MLGGQYMFEDKIVKLRDFTSDLDDRQAKKLNVEQFSNLLIALTDKKLIDETEAAKNILFMIEDVFDQLSALLRGHDIDRAASKAYKKSYASLIAKVKEVFNLEPIGSVQSHYIGIGVALGTSLGTAIMVATSAAMMSIGIALGVAIGAAIGGQKEKEAKEEGRLF